MTVSTERFLWGVVLALVPVVVAVALSPPNVYARAVLGLGAFVTTFPAAYLVAGLRT